MKEILLQYAFYNVWANGILLNVATKLSAEQQQQIIVSSFPGVQKTFLHMLDVESIWWQRMKLNEQIIWPSAENNFDMNQIAEGLINQSKKWQTWVSEASETQLQHVFAYFNSKKEYFKQPQWQMLLHLFNHQTYHRGQIVTMLRQLNVEKIPPTDFIVFSRKK
ncbi:MAG: DinB family protein [Chitinophagaceae bacterium]